MEVNMSYNVEFSAHNKEIYDAFYNFALHVRNNAVLGNKKEFYNYIREKYDINMIDYEMGPDSYRYLAKFLDESSYIMFLLKWK